MITLLILALLITPQWTIQTSGVNVRLRGVSAVSERVAWASGGAQLFCAPSMAGRRWQKLNVTTDTLDFRDIDAVDAQTAYVLGVGNGPASRIYKTTDAGKTWTLQFKNEDPKAFLDAMSFWDANNGIVFGDSVDGQLYIMTTADGGRVWSRVPAASLPPALENEGAFAASGTNIAVFGKSHAWIGTGAVREISRVAYFRSWPDVAGGRDTARRGTVSRNLLDSFPRREAWDHRGRRLSKGAGSGRQPRGHE